MQKFVLSGLFMALLELTGSELTINSYQVPFEPGPERWQINYASSPARENPPELQLLKSGIKKHPKYPHIAGYNGDITLKIAAPGPIRELSGYAEVSNFADSMKRKGQLLYSLNGIDFKTLDEKEFGPGKATFSGKAELPENRGVVYLRYQRALAADDTNGRHGYVLLTALGFTANGNYAKPDERKAKPGANNPFDLKTIFPTGVFWPWERTRPNADFAGMELWDFVDHTMKTLKEHHCDTLWFVNIGPGDTARKILALAEKHGLKVMLNTHLLGFYYHNFTTFQQAENLARRTVNEIGDSPALLGYVLKDEPLLCSLAQCNFFYRLMKQADPGRDSAAIVMNRQSESFLMESDLPVICSDIYYFGHDKSTNIPNPVGVSQKEFSRAVGGLNKTAARSGKHSWLMPQMFGDVWGRHYLKNDKMVVEPGSYLHWRMPTEAETRWQIWEGIRLGSTGMIFYVLYPPIPLQIPPEAVKPGTPEAKRLASMDELAAKAATWKHQELTGKRLEIDPGEGVMKPGGQPTPQMRTMGENFAVLRKYAELLAARKQAPFPVIFAGDAATAVSTFEVPGDYARRWGVVVNNDLNSMRAVKVPTAPNVKRVVNLNTGKELALETETDSFRFFKLDLRPGDGALLEIDFVNGQPGMLLCREEFTQKSQHKVNFNAANACISRFGSYGIEPYYMVQLTGNPEAPVFSLENLTNPQSASNTFAMNLNLKKEQGTIFLLVNGSGVTVKAITASGNGEKTNVSHLNEKNQADGSIAKSRPGRVIREKDSGIPAIVPVGTTALEFFLKDKQSRVEDLTVWYVEKTTP